MNRHPALEAAGLGAAVPRARRWWSRVGEARLSVKLVVFNALLTAGVLGGTFLALSFATKANTRRLLAEELSHNQRSLLRVQERSRQELLWTLSLVTESPTLRAAMETNRMESRTAAGSRPQMLATIQLEVDKIAAGLGRDIIVVTDDGGVVLAATGRSGARPAIGEDLSSLPAVRRALDPLVLSTEPGDAVLRFGDDHYQVGTVPIVLRGFAIGTLTVGQRLDRAFLEELRGSLGGGEILVAADERLVGSTLPLAPAETTRFLALVTRDERAAHNPGTVRAGTEEFVVASLSLGLNQLGRPVVLYLLHPLSEAVAPLNRALLRSFLLYGLVAIVVTSLAAAAASRPLLGSFQRFVRFMRNVAERGEYARRFDASRAPVEIRTLNESYDYLVDSLARKHAQLDERTAELSRTLESLRAEMGERGRAEQALRESEEQLRQSQKLEALGTLAGGVAHDFNNLLTVIGGYADLLAAEFDVGSPLRSDLEQIKQAADRAALLTRQLLAFSRKQVLQPKVIDLNGMVTGVEKMLGRLIGEDIDLRTAKGTPLPRIKTDPGQIEQVIMNLAVNARDAMPRGGTLLIETGQVELNERQAARHGLSRAGRWVMLAVSDTGVGMDEATRARVFEPFFSTKRPGKGTGLGLSTVYGIVTQSGGNIEVESEPGRGATFRIYLPAVKEVGEALPAAAARPSAPAGAETVLLVEDEESVRKLVERSLAGRGYAVLTASHGPEALALAEVHAGPIHLLVTDVVMPHMSGKELAGRLAPRRREMRVLYLSGYTDDAIVHHGVLDAGTEYLQKPFTPDALARKVREVLDAPSLPAVPATTD